MNEELIVKMIPVVRALEVYHRHEVFGLSNIPKSGSVIIASTHSLATYDLVLLMHHIYEKFGRFPRSLIDRAFYKMPMIGSFMEDLGCVVGDQDNARSILSNGEILCIAPGGMKESLRPRTRKYQIDWGSRKGFARLAIETSTPIILAACHSADDIFDVYESKFTSWAYRRFKLPLFIAKGLGPTVLPKPAKLFHMLSEPITPPVCADGPLTDEMVQNFHEQLQHKMTQLICRATKMMNHEKKQKLLENVGEGPTP